MESVRRVPCPRANIMNGRWGRPPVVFGRNLPDAIRSSSLTSRLRENPGRETRIYGRSHGPVVSPCPGTGPSSMILGDEAAQHILGCHCIAGLAWDAEPFVLRASAIAECR